MITNKQKEWLQELLSGKTKKQDFSRKYSAYMGRIRVRIDAMLENLLWLSEKFPDILRDWEYELNNKDIEIKRRAKKMLRAIAMFESEPEIIRVINELFPSHTIELTKRKKE